MDVGGEITTVRTILFTLMGILAGVASGYIVMFFAMNVLAPLTGHGDEMSSGLIGTFTAVIAIPLLALAGGVIGYRRSRNGAEPPG